ncbi:MAG TPA: DUF4157 domain-containing protein, partial [Kofleriaceae bacterium]|nr:DUF4157 domain-containing protein [Kofleriaceae bacterium]
MERALGASLDRVRVHTDAVAAAAVRAVRASAFTVGEDIFFADGAFAPNSEAGRQLLAHELTHVVQAYQGRTARPHSGIEISRPEHPLEREAEANAARLSDPRARGSESRSGSQASPVATGTPPHGTLLLRQEAPASSTSSASETGGTRPREERGGALATSASFEVHGFRAGPSTAGESGPVSDGRRMLVHVQSGGLAASAHVRALTADAQRYTVGFVQTMHHSNRRALYLDYDGHVVATYVASRGRVMDQRTDLGAPRPWYTHGVLLGERSQNPRMSDNPTWEVPRYAEDNSSLVARLEGSEAFTTYLVAMVGNDPSTIVYLGNVQWEVNWAGRFDDRLRFHGHAAHIEPAVRSDQGNAVLSGEPANVGSFGRFEQSRGAASSTSSTTRSAHGGGSGYGHLSDEAVASARTATHVPEGGNEVETPRGRRHLDLSERNAERVAALLEDPAVRAHIEETLEMFENDPDHPIPRSEIDLPLVLATAMREGGPELALSASEHRIGSAGRDAHTLGRSGMDFLYDLRSRFPRAIRDQIQRVHGNPAVGGEFRRASTNPAYIRERDMLAAHIIEARHREQRFRRLFARSFSDRQGFTEEQRAALLASMSLDARRAWVQASFGSRLPQLLTEARTRITRALRAGRTFEEVAADPSVNLCSIITDDSIMSGNLSRQRTRVTAAEARLINEVLPPELRYGPIAGAEAESAAP